MSYTRSILAPYVGETPPPPIGAELPSIMTINKSTPIGGRRGRGISSGGKLNISKNSSLFGDPENPWISFLQTYGNRGLTMPELRQKYHNMQVSVGGRKKMKGGCGCCGGCGSGYNERKARPEYHPKIFHPKYLGGSQLAIGEYNSYAGPRALGLGGSESLFDVSKIKPGYRTRRVLNAKERGRLDQRNLAIDLGGL